MSIWNNLEGRLSIVPELVVAAVREAIKSCRDPRVVDAMLSALLPQVDPDDPGLSDLREWCLTLEERSGLPADIADRLLALAKEYAHRPR